MKKETIFKHELNESIASDAAMACLKNRNKPQQMNEALPLVAGAIRIAMPLLRPLITKLVKSLVMKAGAKLTGRQVAKMVIKNVSNGKTLMKIGKKVGQTWNEIPSELKQEIAKTAIDTFKEMRTQKAQPQLATQEQEEGADEKATFALKLVKKFKNKITPEYAKNPELFMMLKLQKALKKPLMSLSKEEYRAWAKAICDACESVFGASQEQEESADEKYAIAKQLMANYNPDTDEWEDPSVWILYAIQDHIGKQFLKMPKKEVKAWKKAINATLEEYELEKQQEEHSEDADRLQSQLANAWDEGMEDDEDDYVPYNNTFDETHHDIVDTILDEVHRYFEFESDVEGFNLTEYTEEQIGKAIEQILDKTDDFPSSVSNNVCYAWVKKYAEEIIKILETGSLENSYEGHPEFDFSEQEELPSMERHDMILALAEDMAESWIDTGDDGDLDDIYYAIADILDETGDYPQSTDWKDCKPWCQKYYKEVEARIYNEEEEASCTTKVTVRTPMGMKQMNLSTEVIESFVKQTGSHEEFSDRSAVRVIAGIVKEMIKKGYTPTEDEQKIVDIQNKKIKQGIASINAASDRSMNALSD